MRPTHAPGGNPSPFEQDGTTRGKIRALAEWQGGDL